MAKSNKIRKFFNSASLSALVILVFKLAVLIASIFDKFLLAKKCSP